MIRIAIVGDIGSGKSYVAKQFGYPVFNADLEVVNIYKKNKICYKKLKKELPKDVQAGVQEEEDEFMTNLTYGGGSADSLAGTVFAELLKRILGAVGDAEGEEFQQKFVQAYDAAIPEYFHVNEDGKQYALGSILSASALKELSR